MGFLDQLKAQAEGAVQKFSGEHPKLGQEVMNLVHSGPGGLSGLVQRFQAGGLGHLIQSWISTGPNQPASAQQITQALGGDQLRQMAARVGLDPNVVAQRLSTILPQVVDHLTPNGQLPQVAAPQQ
jgi:uncharacterized protein YidB (DUF937 family)